MAHVERFFGKEIDNQEHFTCYCAMLYGRAPEKMDILAIDNSNALVVFDGCCWREFMDKTQRGRRD